MESNALSSRVQLRRGWLVIWLDTSCTVATFTVHLAAWVIYLHGKRLHLSQRDSVGPYHACLLILLLQYLGLLFVMHPSGLLCKFSCGSLGGDWGTAVTEGGLVDLALPVTTASAVVNASAASCAVAGL